MKVLVVEDSGQARSSTSTGLRHLGYRVDFAANWTEALNYAETEYYDVILLELSLDNDSGLAIVDDLRQLDSRVKILILVEPDQIRERVTALIHGADAYLVKPYAWDELHLRIQTLVLESEQPDRR